MKKIKLTKGYYAFVDNGDYARVSQFKWYAVVASRTYGSMYAYNRNAGAMHRFILGVTDPKVEVDHKDHNGLNCRQRNLRLVTHVQNMQNQRKKSNNTSGFKGVTWDKDRSLWRARIMLKGKCINLCRCKTAREAAKAYDKAALKLYGKFASLNFPKEK